LELKPNFFRLAGVALCVVLALNFAIGQSEGTTRVSFAGLGSPVTLKPGKSSEALLRFVVAPGFHINSNAPKSDLLIPTSLKIDPAGVLSTSKISYAEGKDLSLPFDPSTKLNVYSGEFMVRASLLASSNATPGKATLHGQLRYQACSDRSCFPPKTLPVDFDVTVTPR